MFASMYGIYKVLIGASVLIVSAHLNTNALVLRNRGKAYFPSFHLVLRLYTRPTDSHELSALFVPLISLCFSLHCYYGLSQCGKCFYCYK